MGLIVIQPGLSATVQDLGRTGFRRFGVPSGGAFDTASAALANALLNNPSTAAVLELTLLGGTYEASKPLGLALTGAPMRANLVAPDGREVALAAPLAFRLGRGWRLILGGASSGARAYLAVRGGWQTSVVLGSRSSETILKPGDVVAAGQSSTPVRRVGLADDPFATAGGSPLRVVAGPNFARLGLEPFDGAVPYEVLSQSDRIGLRLEGPPIAIHPGPERLSAPVAAGAVQVAGGKLIVLGVACGTMGGYPHVAHVITPDLDRLAQARPGERLRFRRIELAEARALDRRARLDWAARLVRIASAVGDLAGAEGLLDGD